MNRERGVLFSYVERSVSSATQHMSLFHRRHRILEELLTVACKFLAKSFAAGVSIP